MASCLFSISGYWSTENSRSLVGAAGLWYIATGQMIGSWVRGEENVQAEMRRWMTGGRTCFQYSPRAALYGMDDGWVVFGEA